MARLFMRLAAAFPLPVLHAAGTLLGWVMYLASVRYRTHLKENLALAGFGENVPVRHDAIASAGCMITELPALWLRPHAEVAALVREIAGLDLVQKAQAEGRGIVF